MGRYTQELLYSVLTVYCRTYENDSCLQKSLGRCSRRHWRLSVQLEALPSYVSFAFVSRIAHGEVKKKCCYLQITTDSC